MADAFFFKDEQYLLNRCTKYLARYEVDYRHTYSTDGIQRPTDNIAEAWRFPIIDTYAGGANSVTNTDDFDNYNEVTFIYAGSNAQTPRDVRVLCTFTGFPSGSQWNDLGAVSLKCNVIPWIGIVSSRSGTSAEGKP